MACMTERDRNPSLRLTTPSFPPLQGVTRCDGTEYVNLDANETHTSSNPQSINLIVSGRDAGRRSKVVSILAMDCLWPSAGVAY